MSSSYMDMMKRMKMKQCLRMKVYCSQQQLALYPSVLQLDQIKSLMRRQILHFNLVLRVECLMIKT